MKKLSAIVFLAIVLSVASANAQSTEFIYQGQLTNSSAPANGNFDLEFALFDAAFGGSQLGSSVSRSSTAVTNGIFSVTLDFGNQFSGGSRFLEIRVRLAGGGGYTTLSPRQPVGSSPYAVRSVSASTANTAASASSATTFTGNLAGDVTGTQISTSVDRLRGRPLAATPPNNGQVLKYNSTNGRWEPSTDETGSSGGGGTITGVTAGTGLTGGGTTGQVSVAIANGGVGSQQIADGSVTDTKILGVSGAKVTGAVASATNATSSVSFTGSLIGDVTGTQSATTISPGSITTGKLADASVTNAKIADVSASKITGAFPVGAIPAGSGNYIQNQSSAPQASTSFNISGDGTAGGTLSAQTVTAAVGFNVSQWRVLSIPGTQNLYVGRFVGGSSTGTHNTFVGNLNGSEHRTGNYNSFFGFQVGDDTYEGSENTFIGALSGRVNGSGNRNTALGYSAHAGFNGNGNTALGWATSVSNPLENATAVGARAVVNQSNSIVLGAIAGVNSATANTSVGIGTASPRGGLEVKRNWDGGFGAITVTGDRPTIKFSSDSPAAANQQWLLHVGGAAGSVPAGSLAYFNGGTGGASFGSPVFAIAPTNTVMISTLGTGGMTALCRNALNEISTCSSSLRYKTNVSSFRSGLDLVKQLRPITFDWTDGGMHDLGLGAEDVAKIEPLLVTYNAKGEVEGVKYDRIGVILVNAVKEQQLQIDRQNELIRLQQAELKALRSFVCSKKAKAGFCKIKK